MQSGHRPTQSPLQSYPERGSAGSCPAQGPVWLWGAFSFLFQKESVRTWTSFPRPAARPATVTAYKPFFHSRTQRAFQFMPLFFLTSKTGITPIFPQQDTGHRGGHADVTVPRLEAKGTPDQWSHVGPHLSPFSRSPRLPPPPPSRTQRAPLLAPARQATEQRGRDGRTAEAWHVLLRLLSTCAHTHLRRLWGPRRGLCCSCTLGARHSTPGSCWVDEGTAVSPTSAGRTAPSPLASRDGKPVPGNADQCTASEERRTRGRSTSRRPRGLEEQRWQSVCSPTPGQQSADGGPVTQQS